MNNSSIKNFCTLVFFNPKVPPSLETFILIMDMESADFIPYLIKNKVYPDHEGNIHPMDAMSIRRLRKQINTLGNKNYPILHKKQLRRTLELILLAKLRKLDKDRTKQKRFKKNRV